MRRETVLALAIVVVVVGYIAWGTRNVIRSWEAAPATPAPLAARTTAPLATSSSAGAATAPTAVAAVVATTGATPAVAGAAQTGAGSAPLAASPTATTTVLGPNTLAPALALAATALAPVTQPGALQTPAATHSTTTPSSQPSPASTLSASAPDAQSPATVTDPVLAPPATPLSPAPAPAAGPRQSIAGLAYPDISARLSMAFGMVCSGPAGSDLLTWQCVALSAGGTVRLTAVINGLDAERIVSITGVVSQSGPADAAVVSKFLGFVAALPFEGTQAQQAQAWVVDHLAGEGRTAIGGSAAVLPTMLSLSGTAAVRTLDVYAPHAQEGSR